MSHGQDWVGRSDEGELAVLSHHLSEGAELLPERDVVLSIPVEAEDLEGPLGQPAHVNSLRLDLVRTFRGRHPVLATFT